MRDVQIPDAHFELSATCSKCKTGFVAETDDLELDGFKKPGTHWFDGSADAAGVDYLFFVQCPNADCEHLTVVDPGQIPAALGLRLLAQKDAPARDFTFA